MSKKQLIAALTAERTDDQPVWPVVAAEWLLPCNSVTLVCTPACAGNLIAGHRQTDLTHIWSASGFGRSSLSLNFQVR